MNTSTLINTKTNYKISTYYSSVLEMEFVFGYIGNKQVTYKEAADLASKLTINGHNDWIIPTEVELREFGIETGFDIDGVWTSTPATDEEFFNYIRSKKLYDLGVDAMDAMNCISRDFADYKEHGATFVIYGENKVPFIKDHWAHVIIARNVN